MVVRCRTDRLGLVLRLLIMVLMDLVSDVFPAVVVAELEGHLE